jgi:hypothetical protein
MMPGKIVAILPGKKEVGRRWRIHPPLLVDRYQAILHETSNDATHIAVTQARFLGYLLLEESPRRRSWWRVDQEAASDAGTLGSEDIGRSSSAGVAIRGSREDDSQPGSLDVGIPGEVHPVYAVALAHLAAAFSHVGDHDEEPDPLLKP